MQTLINLEMKYLYVLSTSTHLHLYVSKAICCPVYSSCTFYQCLQACDPANAYVLFCDEVDGKYSRILCNGFKLGEMCSTIAEIYTPVRDYQLNSL